MLCKSQISKLGSAIVGGMSTIKNVATLSQIGIRSLSEDRVLANEQLGLFGVFDGASSLNKFTTPDGKTGGYIAASIAMETFQTSSGNLLSAALQANRNIEATYKKLGVEIDSPVDRFSTTASVVKINENTVDLLQIADSVIIVIYKDGHAEVPLGYHDHDLDVMRTWRTLADSGATDIRKIVADDVIELRRQANTTYGMLNGDARSKDFIATSTLDLSNIATIILLTDGMYLPKENPEQDEDWNEYARLYKKGGLQRIYDTVRELELSDPKLSKYPRYKMHDDASAVAIDLA